MNNLDAILPAKVRYDNILSDGAKMLYAEVMTLTTKSKCCWATNSYFSKAFDKSRGTVSRYISELDTAGHVRITFFIQNGKTKRRIYPLTKSLSKKIKKQNDAPSATYPSEDEVDRAMGWGKYADGTDDK